MLTTLLRSAEDDGRLALESRLRLFLDLLLLNLLADELAEDARRRLLLLLFVVVSSLLLLLHLLVHSLLEFELLHVIAASDKALWYIEAEQLLVVELEFWTRNLALLDQLLLWVYLEQDVSDVLQSWLQLPFHCLAWRVLSHYF